MHLAHRRIAIVNRGEPAMRLINAVRELRYETGADVRSIALYTPAERAAMFVREADDAVALEPSPAGAAGAVSPYLDFDALGAALQAAEADAAWVGWGFVAERPEFAELCESLGVAFIGPRPDVMRRLGDKIGAKLLAEKADVPVAAWSSGPVDTVAAAGEHAARIGYPLMIKATAGGGGRGIRRVDSTDQLEEAFTRASEEAGRSFGDPTVFLERVVTGARHVEVQLVGDDHGTVWALGVRDCTLQRRNQKVIEESGCVVLTARQDADLRAAAVRLAEVAGYTNAGTVEFLYQPAEEAFAFLEVNTRLQVEHPVTELTTGVDIVKLQLHVAAGGRLEGEPPPTSGFAVEARLNAEDPENEFAPAPGTIRSLSFPVGSGIRVDTGVAEGDVIPPAYDSMIAKIIGVGRDRPEALARLRRALDQTVALIDGGTTNKSFLLGLFDRPEIVNSAIDTGWLDRLTATGGHMPTAYGDVALVAAAIDAATEERRRERERFCSLASRGRPDVEPAAWREVELRSGQHAYRLDVRQLGPDRYAVRLAGDPAGDPAGDTVLAERRPLTEERSILRIAGRDYPVVAVAAGAEGAKADAGGTLVEVAGVTHRFSRDAVGIVRAPSASLVVAVDVAPGDQVAAGDRIAVLEAMKMEVAVSAPIDGTVGEVYIAPSAQVDAGVPLIRIEPAGDAGAQPAATEPVRLAALVSDAAGSNRPDPVDTLASFMLGYDVDGGDARAAAAAATAVDGDGDLAALHLFADLCSLAPERRAVEPGDDTSPREYFTAFLHSFDTEREGLPAWYVERLERALAHYGATLDGDDRAAVVAAAVRIFVAGKQRGEQLAVVGALLERRLADTGCDTETELDALRGALDRVIEATQRRHPEIASLARAVRFRCFDRPVIERHQAAVTASMRELLGDLLSDSGDTAAADALVACPLPLLRLFDEGRRFTTTPNPAPLLEVLTRRYYRIRDLGPVGMVESAGLHVVRGRYIHKDRAVSVLAVRAALNEVAAALGATAAVAADVPDPETAVVDLYVTSDDGDEADDPERADRVATTLLTQLNDTSPVSHDGDLLPSNVRRVAAIVIGPSGNTEHFTFRRTGSAEERPSWMLDDDAALIADPDRFAEDIKFRGLHPMIARRLQMWRLINFRIRRLPSADDVYAFACKGRDNPADERLVAVAEVRDLTPVRDRAGRVVALPGVEHVLVACLDAIRHALARRPAGRRLEWNRVMLYVWPTVDFSLDEVNEIVRRLAPLTEGLGLEQVVVTARFARPGPSSPAETVLRLGYEPGRGLTVRFTAPSTEPLQPLDDYTRKRIQSRRRGAVYPYELAPLLAGDGGTFLEHDLDESGALVPVDRQPGGNSAGVVVGMVSTPDEHHPGGIRRVAVLGDPTKAMGAITEAECRRIIAAIDVAEREQLPIDWFALSAGAKIAMDSGSENLDWVARVLRRIVAHTQRAHSGRGGEINVVVAGINVGAQPYWNAEATMLMHTSGTLVMTPDSAMVLTGKQAIDYSGGVSAEDNLGIGGYARVMGPNGEAQYFAPTIAAACDLLLDRHRLTYVAPGERWAPRAATADPFDRDVRSAPHPTDASEFSTVGDIFSATANPDRKKPFDIRAVMNAVVDTDSAWIERWPEMADADGAVVWDGRLGGHAVTLLGIESRPLPRHGLPPADGPGQWSAATLFPLSSKKVARAINAASGRRPVVVLANLSGFDGSPESLRRLQLEYGAEIGRAIVNFDGPFVLCVVSRYHGGAFVVFSATLNDHIEVLAVEGSFASVIGGAPAAAVVFTREVDARTRADTAIVALEEAVAAAASDDEASVLRAELATVRDAVRTEKLGEVAAEFDRIHTVERARQVGSVHRIIAPADLRPELIAAVERGIARYEG